MDFNMTDFDVDFDASAAAAPATPSSGASSSLEVANPSFGSEVRRRRAASRLVQRPLTHVETRHIRNCSNGCHAHFVSYDKR